MRPTPALRGIRIISLALNLPGPAALMRLSQMGARCTKVNPPAGDPMQAYTPEGYAQLHQGVQEITLDLKSAAGHRRLDQRLAKTDVLLTSFRPSALRKLGLDWASLQARHPQLCLVEVVGEPGHAGEHLQRCHIEVGPLSLPCADQHVHVVPHAPMLGESLDVKILDVSTDGGPSAESARSAAWTPGSAGRSRRG